MTSVTTKSKDSKFAIQSLLQLLLDALIICAVFSSDSIEARDKIFDVLDMMPSKFRREYAGKLLNYTNQYLKQTEFLIGTLLRKRTVFDTIANIAGNETSTELIDNSDSIFVFAAPTQRFALLPIANVSLNTRNTDNSNALPGVVRKTRHKSPTALDSAQNAKTKALKFMGGVGSSVRNLWNSK
ncbi:MAG: hypothetical protein CMI56_00640 [Parcubacteria group bacterium]|nr:hypothetical protein [Parcubacteria group bacterium]|tara:strand:+ start:56 stop:607 length:552 start_codon:yes stop_codon:yes gene_type:complete